MDELARYIDSLDEPAWRDVCEAAMKRAEPKIEALGELRGAYTIDARGNFHCSYFVYYGEVAKELLRRSLREG